MSDEDPVAGSVAALRVASSLVRMEPKFFAAGPEGAHSSRRGRRAVFGRRRNFQPRADPGRDRSTVRAP